MPKRLRLTRRPQIAMTEDGYRKLRKLAVRPGSTKGSSSPSSSSTGAAW
jgi:hypothetical protein